MVYCLRVPLHNSTALRSNRDQKKKKKKKGVWTDNHTFRKKETEDITFCFFFFIRSIFHCLSTTFVVVVIATVHEAVDLYFIYTHTYL